MQNTKKEILQLDVKRVLQNKSPRLAKRLPRFVISYLKKIIHQQEMNEFLKSHGHKKNTDFSGSILSFMNIQYKIMGEDNIPSEGKYIFVSNHPLGGMDGIMLIDYFGRKYPGIKFPVNDILLQIENFDDIFIPVNKLGGQTKEYVRQLNQTYASDLQVLLFPAGIVSRKKKGKITDLPWEKSFIGKAIQFQRNVVPIHVSGRNSSFFYNLANLRTFLGIKTNLEMLFLPNEMFKHQNKVFTITIGQPISYIYFDKKKSYLEWANYVKEVVYKLPNI